MFNTETDITQISSKGNEFAITAKIASILLRSNKTHRRQRMSKPKILVFASGSPEGGGSGFEKLVLASKGGRLQADIIAVVSNHANGGVRSRADKLGVPFLHFPKPWTAEAYQKFASDSGAEYFALSGWLKLVAGLDPKTRFNSRTVFNIHPGPLPDFGGPGLYGHHVHEAVMNAYKEQKIAHSAVCMHFVTGEYDRGPVFFRCNVRINDGDTPDSIGARVNEQEHIHQPMVTSLVVNGLIKWDGVDPRSLQVPTGYSIECREKSVHADVKCHKCSHKGATCLEVRGGHWMTMECLSCGFVFSIDGE